MVDVLSKCYLFQIPNENLKQNRTVLVHVSPHSGTTSNLGHTTQHNIVRTSFSEKSLGENFPKKVKSKNKMPLQSVVAINVINIASCITLKSEKCRSKAGFIFQPELFREAQKSCIILLWHYCHGEQPWFQINWMQ